jgi:glycosyltransferase involved in cell wall biosynthesis
VRVDILDPPAYTPPYDHALCRALGRAGAQVGLYTSRFAYGPVPRPDGYERHDFFYRHAHGPPGSRGRRLAKLVEHIPDMLRYRQLANGPEGPDVVHFQWLAVQYVDGLLLPSGARALVLTAHDVLPRQPLPGQLAAQRRLYGHFDAIIVHSEHGRRRLLDELGVQASRVRVIPHGAFTHLAAGPPPARPHPGQAPVVLCFGLLRPYKGLEILLEAWRGITGAELWIAGMARMDTARLRATVAELNEQPAELQGRVRLDDRFINDDELPGYFAHADLVVLPYREIDQSGVLFTALAFGRPLLLSDVGGFPELARTGAARIVPAGASGPLREALVELLEDRAELAEMGRRARDAASGRYAWEQIGRAHVTLYEELLAS